MGQLGIIPSSTFISTTHVGAAMRGRRSEADLISTRQSTSSSFGPEIYVRVRKERRHMSKGLQSKKRREGRKDQRSGKERRRKGRSK
eukprot:755742-Hanusia_phi.AAC.1